MKQFSQIIDISLPIKPGMTVYPKNPQVEIETNYTGSTWVSRIVIGSHTGTHFDAPRHAFEDKIGVDKLNLNDLIGPCRVLDFSTSKISITLDEIKSKSVKSGERLLLKTSNSTRGYDQFYNDYIFLSGDAADYLADIKPSLVAIDYFSIKQRGSSDQRPHTSLLSQDIPIIEAVDLSKVNQGNYFLVALPLKIKDLDGSPARVVLLKD